jgi:hypothetical protein
MGNGSAPALKIFNQSKNPSHEDSTLIFSNSDLLKAKPGFLNYSLH